MSNTTNPGLVNTQIVPSPEFYQLRSGDKITIPYPIASIAAADFVLSLREAGWREEVRDGITLVLHAPDDKFSVFMGRIAA